MIRGLIYDAMLLPVTHRWYREVLPRAPMQAHLLDVGIGTGGALARNRDLIKQRRLRITGIDIDADYVRRAQRRIATAGLADSVEVRLESVYDHHGGPYDIVYFSASFMLLPEPVRALQHVSSLLKPHGRIFFTQTFNERRSTLLERTKPLLGRITPVVSGRGTYADDFLAPLAAGDVQLLEFVYMNRSPLQSYRLAVAAPRNGDGASALPS